MRAMSFATGDHVRFNVLLRDLDGNFSGRLPVTIGSKPEVERPRDADPREPRRLLALDDWRGHQEQGVDYRPTATRSRQVNPFRVPFAVAGDDIVWFSYNDVNHRSAAGRAFLPVASQRTLDDLQLLGVNVAQLPETAIRTGVEIVLKDPYLQLQERRRERDGAVLRQIARKKRHYRGMLEDYQLTMERIGRQIDELTARQAGRTDAAADAEAEGKEPAVVHPDDAPLTVEEELNIELGGEDYDLEATEDLIRAAALRRDRDGLALAMRALEARLRVLDARYKTEELEAEIDKFEAEYRPQDLEETLVPPRGRPVAWYNRPDWWLNCGGLVPGVPLNILVKDRNLPGDSVEVLIAALGGGEPEFHSFTAKAVEGEEGTFAVTVLTSHGAGGNGAGGNGAVLPVGGVRDLYLSYKEAGERRFSEQRVDFLSLASNADLMVTGSDFIDTKESFHLGEEIYIVVRDADMDKTSERDYIWVEIESSTGDIERAPIRESQPHSGVFRGSIRTALTGEAILNDGLLSGEFGGTFAVRYVDELWRTDSPVPPVLVTGGHFVSGTDGLVEIFARQLRRGALQRDVLFNTALASYELGNSSMEMGAVQRGRQHLLDARNRFEMLITAYPDDEVCAHATYYLGNIHFLLGDYPAAVQSLQEVVTRWPKTEFKAMALFKLGTCHMRAGHMDRAVESFVNLAYHHSDSPLVGDSMLVLAGHFSQQQRFKASISVGEAFLSKFPDHDRAGNMYLRVAGWLIMEEEYRRAIEVLEDAEKNLPDSPNMPAYLYWHADCIFRILPAGSGRSSNPEVAREYNRGIILLRRIMYDYPDSKWAQYAQARLAEKDTAR